MMLGCRIIWKTTSNEESNPRMQSRGLVGYNSIQRRATREGLLSRLSRADTQCDHASQFTCNYAFNEHAPLVPLEGLLSDNGLRSGSILALMNVMRV